jgi:hypothetical protein
MRRRRFFFDPKRGIEIPVEEATIPLLVQPNKSDIKGATKDPENCIFARCLKRILDASYVYIFKATAYVEMLNSRGERVMRRFTLGTGARQYTSQFDKGAKLPPGGFHLDPPARGEQLDHKHAFDVEYRRSGRKAKAYYARKKALIKGTAKVNSTRLGRAAFRGGEGMVHFRFEQDETPAMPSIGTRMK